MTPSEFIQKFCPDFEAKQQQREVLKRSIITPGNFDDKIAFIRASRSLSDEMFYEALKNYTRLVREGENKSCEATFPELIEHFKA